MRETTWRMAWLVAVGLARAASATGAALPDPAKPGPYPVGVTRTLLVDAARTDALTGKPRTLVTEIWYPATDAARSRLKNRFRDFLPVPGGGLSRSRSPLFPRRFTLKRLMRYITSTILPSRERNGKDCRKFDALVKTPFRAILPPLALAPGPIL